MKKLLLLSVFLIFACSSDDEGNPCVYEPTLTTEAATDITDTSATLNGTIDVTSENCEVPDNIAEQGFVYSTEIQPTLEDIQVNVNGANITTTIEGLQPDTTYYVRSFMTNNFGDFYGDEIDFMTAEVSLVNCDGNPIQSIVYGTQEWTVENACHITYRDGTPIPEVTDYQEWTSLVTGAWCYYDNDPTKHRLYNWYAFMGIHDNNPNTPNKEFAPEDWHVPSDTDWTILEEYLIANGYNYDGTTGWDLIAKAMASAANWKFSQNTGVPGNDPALNNSSGFNAFPEGYRGTVQEFVGGGIQGIGSYFWTTNAGDGPDGNVFMRYLVYGSVRFDRTSEYINKSFGFSVRFVRD